MLMQKLIQKPSVDWQKLLSTFMVFHIAFPLIKKNFQSKLWHRPMLMEFTGIITRLICHHSMVEGPLEYSITVLLGTNTLQGWAKVLLEGHICSESVSNIALLVFFLFFFFFQSLWIQESRNQPVVKMEVKIPTIINTQSP